MELEMNTPHPRETNTVFIEVSALPRRLGRALVMLYRYTLAPLIGPRCRHLPSCSEYADEAIARFGLWIGSWMALARILRCHPFGTHGLDFVPAQAPANARWYLPWRYGRWRGTNDTAVTRRSTTPQSSSCGH